MITKIKFRISHLLLMGKRWKLSEMASGAHFVLHISKCSSINTNYTRKLRFGKKKEKIQ